MRALQTTATSAENQPQENDAIDDDMLEFGMNIDDIGDIEVGDMGDMGDLFSLFDQSGAVLSINEPNAVQEIVCLNCIAGHHTEPEHKMHGGTTSPTHIGASGNLPKSTKTVLNRANTRTCSSVLHLSFSRR